MHVRGRVVRHVWARVGRWLIAACVVLSMLVLSLVNVGRLPQHRAGGAVQYPASLAAIASGCGGVVTWPSAPAEEIGSVPDGSTFAYRVSPPSSGNFAIKPWTGPSFVTVLDKDKPSVEQALALQYRGWVTVWYRADISTPLETSLSSWADKLPAGSKVLVAPWPFDADLTWRAGRVIIVAGWNRTQACLAMTDQGLEEFRQGNRAPGVGLSVTDEAPRARVVTATVNRESDGESKNSK